MTPDPVPSALQEETRTQSIGAAFERVVAKRSRHAAVREFGRETSYADLDALANQVAGAVLSQAGDEPGRRIALLFESGSEAMAAMLGVLKSGHAYVPLDPENPDERLRYVLEDSGSFLLLSQEDLAPRARALSGSIPTLAFPEIRSGASANAPRVDVPDTAMTYLLYTSGSTGKPKGVRQTHRNLRHWTGVYSRNVGIEAEDRVSALASFAFSASTMDIYGGLLAGATVCPLDLRKRGTGNLAEWIEEEGITILHFVPSLFRHLLRMNPDRKFPKIRAIDLASEMIHPSDVVLFRKHFDSNCRLIHHLACTEVNVIAQERIEAAPASGILTVGRPSDSLTVRIVRDDGAEAGVGETGEILVRGAHVSPGYWNRPDLTEAAFSEEPLGERTYRTGDLGWLDAEGKLFFLGRKESRLKVRGFSIHASEVEAALRESPRVKDAAVIAGSQGGEDATLIAYIVLAEAKSADAEEVRSDLEDRIPGYMMPNEIFFLDALPLNASGKIDRKALKELDLTTTRETSFEAPRDRAEQRVALVFEQVLGVKPIGRRCDFFQRGGDSLKVIELQAALLNSLGIQITVDRILEDPTVTGIVSAWRRKWVAGKGESSPVLFPLRKGNESRPFFFVHGLRGRAILRPHFLDAFGVDQPVYGFQLRGMDGSERPRRRIEHIAADYVRAMREMDPREPYMIGGMCSGCMVSMEMARQLKEAGAAVAPLVFMDPPGIAPCDRPITWTIPYRLDLHMAKLPIPGRLGWKIRRRFLARVGWRIGEDRLSFDLDAPGNVKDEVAARIAFRLALTDYRPKPYDGPIHAIVSKERLRRGRGRRFTERYFLGPVTVHVVAEMHKSIFKESNALFVETLRLSFQDAQSWKPGTPAPTPSVSPF